MINHEEDSNEPKNVTVSTIFSVLINLVFNSICCTCPNSISFQRTKDLFFSSECLTALQKRSKQS